MAGLLAARVLSEFYERVTLIDRDTFPAPGQHRRGVPQSVHTHGLLYSGRRVLDRYFPGLAEKLFQAGAVRGDVLADSRWYFEDGYLSKTKSGMEAILISRPALEDAVRDRALKIPNLTVIENCVVEGLVASADGRRVAGVRTSHETIDADLVVDASGRGSHSPAWLESIGYPKPQEVRVEVGIGYTTRLFRRSEQQLNGDGAAVIPPTPEGRRGGVMLAQEGWRWTVTLIAYFKDYAPVDLDGFIEFARTLPAPDIYETIRHSEPIGEASSARFPASVRRRYEALPRFPEGYLVFGDAICSFNPIYGQGMSVAALQAEALDQSLSTGRVSARDFFSRAAKVVNTPWSVAVGSDLRIPETIGPRSKGGDFINWYIARLHRAAHRDPAASLAFLKVANLVAPPPSLMHPKIALRVARANLRGAPRNGNAPPGRAESAG